MVFSPPATHLFIESPKVIGNSSDQHEKSPTGSGRETQEVLQNKVSVQRLVTPAPH